MRWTPHDNAGTVLDVQGLCIATNDKSIVQDLSFSLKQGETLGIVGISGVGKSSLARALIGMLPCDFQVKAAAADINGDAMDLSQQNDAYFAKVRRHSISYLPQEPKAAMNPLHTVAQQFAPIFAQRRREGERISKSEERWQICTLLEQSGLTDAKRFLFRYAHQLSGGEARRVSIALTLARRTPLIIADEPTSALDGELRDEVLDLLQNLCRQAKIALLIISHDLPSIAHRCDQLLLMDHGEHHLGDRVSIEYQPLWQMLNQPLGKPPAMPRAPTSYVLQLQCVSLHFARFFENFTWLAKLAGKFGKFTADNDAHYILKNLNFQIEKGQIVGIQGRSGVGKSTLVRAITRLDHRLKLTGKILVNGKWHYPKNAAQLVMQEVQASLNPLRTIEQSLQEAIEYQSVIANENDGYTIDALFSLMNLPKSLLKKYPHELSGGECQRACIVRALLVRPALLILDEPTAMLDRIATASLLELLRNINQSLGVTILIISHDAAVMSAICQRILVIKDKQLHEKPPR